MSKKIRSSKNIAQQSTQHSTHGGNTYWSIEQDRRSGKTKTSSHYAFIGACKMETFRLNANVCAAFALKIPHTPRHVVVSTPVHIFQLAYMYIYILTYRHESGFMNVAVYTYFGFVAQLFTGVIDAFKLYFFTHIHIYCCVQMYVRASICS